MSHTGDYYEQLALDYLLNQGLQLVERNFQAKVGEIDLIMRQGQCWVFVEVKYRKSSAFGGAIAAITRSKQLKVLKTVQFYQQRYRLSAQPCRIDVLTIEGQPPYQYQWLQNAFS